MKPTDTRKLFPLKGQLALIPVQETCPFSRLIWDWLDACRANGRSDKTIADYQDKVFKFWWWYSDYTKLADSLGRHPENVSKREARQYAAYLRDPQEHRWGITTHANNRHKETLAAASIANYGRAVKVFFNWLVEEDEIAASPFTKGINFGPGQKDQDRVIKVLDDDDLSKIFDWLLLPLNLDTYHGTRNLAIMSLLLDTGIRRGELLNIRLSDIDLENQRVRIRPGPAGGKTGGRMALFSITCREAIKRYWRQRGAQLEYFKGTDPDEPFWYTWDYRPLTSNGFASIVRQVRAGSGVNFHAHMMRHTFATKLAGDKVALSVLKELLGHKDIGITQMYIQHNQQTLAEVHRQHSPLSALKSAGAIRKRVGRPRKEGII
jgi:site-specific recombinase XerD